jgi:hypothetical protein
VSICSHWCLVGLCTLHSELLEDVLCILHLGYEDALFELFYLKAEEVGQLAHHRHLEFLHHHPAKLHTRLLIGRTKYYVINLYLAYKQVTITGFSEKSWVIPCSWCLLKPIERLRELVDMVGIPVFLEAMGLFHVHILLYWSIEEGALHVHLKKLKRVVSNIG